jgi:uridylate kinase
VSRPRFQRILLKLSGNCISDEALLARIVDQVIAARRAGVQVAIVMGGGNILRGRDTKSLDRVAADRAGMLATVINAVRLAGLIGRRAPVRHLSAIGIRGTVEDYDVWSARRALADGTILLLSGGTGNPFFSTDSAAALRAAELNLDAILKGTRVAGVYSQDPEKFPRARLHRRLGYEQALREKLTVMDLTAFALCMERRIPIVVFDIARPRAITDIISGKAIGSLVC